MMGTLRLLNRSLVHGSSPASCSVALCILCLIVPAFAQGQDSVASLPTAPSPTATAGTPQANAPSATAPVGTSNSVDHSLTFGERVHIYRRSVFNPDTNVGPGSRPAVHRRRVQRAGCGQGAEASV